jgi:hypothetical protein
VGLTTSPIPFGARTFQIDLDFIEHGLRISIDDGRREAFALQPRPVAGFHAELMERMRSLGLDVPIWTKPCEIEHPLRFEEDHQHAAYDPDFADRFLVCSGPGRTASSRFFERAFSARSARSIFTGAASIWQ